MQRVGGLAMKTKYVPTDKRGRQKLAIALNLIPNTPPLPADAFSLIVADPPWQYNLRESDKTYRGRCPYPSMTDEEILEIACKVQYQAWSRAIPPSIFIEVD